MNIKLRFMTIELDRAVKKAVFDRLDAICPPSKLLAGRTSYMDIFQVCRDEKAETGTGCRTAHTAEILENMGEL